MLTLSSTVTSLISSLIPSTPTLLHSLSSTVSSFEPSSAPCEVSRHTMVSSFAPRSLSSSDPCLYPIILCPSLSPSPILKIEHGYDQSSVTSFIPSAVPIVDPSTVPGLKPSLILTDTNSEPSYVSILRNHIWCFFTSSFCHNLLLYIEGLLSTSSQTSPKLSAPGLRGCHRLHLDTLTFIQRYLVSLKSSHQSILLVVMILPWNLASRGCVSIWISASYLEFIPMIPMKDKPPFMKDIPFFPTLFPVIHCFKWD